MYVDWNLEQGWPEKKKKEKKRKKEEEKVMWSGNNC